MHALFKRFNYWVLIQLLKYNANQTGMNIVMTNIKNDIGQLTYLTLVKMFFKYHLIKTFFLDIFPRDSDWYFLPISMEPISVI